ncbi:tyrosine-type recombinase/integrase [Geosporobacter ferrireducens]|uniref:tyrosine-type recombinase/integrase n=1 Tax=Geosporobacter ferrireducens TaxID=1424294 RepID=UPI0009F6CF90|nr:tyrosine-type recombinase/integrase [Geosporobacter ferrireducens]
MFLTYSASLRVGEVVRLKVDDIDSDRMLMHIRQGKGRKDRIYNYKEIFPNHGSQILLFWNKKRTLGRKYSSSPKP